MSQQEQILSGDDLLNIYDEFNRQIGLGVMDGFMRTETNDDPPYKIVNMFFNWNGKHFTLSFRKNSLNLGWGGVSDNAGLCLYVWHTRFGKPYQNALESHVAGFLKVNSVILQEVMSRRLIFSAIDQEDLFATA